MSIRRRFARLLVSAAAQAAIGMFWGNAAAPRSASADTFTWTAGNFIPGTTAPNPMTFPDVLEINAGATKTFAATSWENQWTVLWLADSVFMQSGASVTNAGRWEAREDNSLANNGGAASTFNNTGHFTKTGGGGTTSIGSIRFINTGMIEAQIGTINFGGNNATFNAGSEFSGAGSITVSSNATFSGAFTTSNLSLTAGTITGNAAQINGNLNYNGGTMTGSWEIASGQTLSGNTGGNKIMSVATLINNGTLRWQTANPLLMQTSTAITNNGLHDVELSSSLANNGGTASSYTNSNTGTLRVAAGQTMAIGSIVFVNDGGRLQADGTLDFAGDNATFRNGTLFTGAGSNIISSNASFSDTITTTNLLLQGGTYTGSLAVLMGTTDLSGGTLTGTWELPSGQVLNGKAGTPKVLSAATVTNKGSVQWQTGNPFALQSASRFDNQGSFNMLSGASLANNGGTASSFINSGTLSVAAGQTSNVGTIVFVNNAGTLAVEGQLNFGGANATFNAGTVFGGGGVAAVTTNATFNGEFSSTNLSLRAGAFTGSNVLMNGVVEYTGGTLTGTWELPAGQIMRGRDGGPKVLSLATLVNRGTMNWQTVDSLSLQSGTRLENRGIFDMQAGAVLANSGGAAPTFDNIGTLRVAPGQTSSVGSIVFVNNGGTIDAGAGGSMNFAGSNATFNAGTHFSGAGVNMLTTNATFNGAFDSTNLSLRAGTFTGNAATLSGSAEFGGGTMLGNWTVAPAATFNIVDGIAKNLNGATLTNQGTVAWKTANTLGLLSSADLLNQGTLDLQSDASMVFNGGVACTFVNSGTIRKSAGAGISVIGANLMLTNNGGSIDVQTGTLSLQGGLTIAAGTTLNKTGPATLRIPAAQPHGANANLTASGGTIRMATNAGTPATSSAAAITNLSISVPGDGAAVILEANQDLKNLTVPVASVGNQSVDLNSLPAAGAFTALRVYAADLVAAKAMLYAAMKNANVAGAPSATDGIYDSGRAAHANSGLGIARRNDARGNPHLLIRLTRIGDLNLDNNVTISDFIDLASNFNNETGLATWQEGDLNYDGNVTISDFIDLASNFNTSYASTEHASAISQSDRSALAAFASNVGVDPAVIGSAVPEPGTVAFILLAALAAIKRRRRALGVK